MAQIQNPLTKMRPERVKSEQRDSDNSTTLPPHTSRRPRIPYLRRSHGKRSHRSRHPEGHRYTLFHINATIKQLKRQINRIRPNQTFHGAVLNIGAPKECHRNISGTRILPTIRNQTVTTRLAKDFQIWIAKGIISRRA